MTSIRSRHTLYLHPTRFCLDCVLLVCFGLLIGIITASAEPIRVVSYNVENFFHPAHDSLTNDWEWTPEGERHWSYKRYNQKAENIARVLTTIGEWSGVDLVGLCEVENAACLKKLCYLMRRQNFGFVHYDSPDARGIDVALLYRRSCFDTICTRLIPVDLGEITTRDIVYVGLATKHTIPIDTLHVLVCHLPSQLGGKAESEWKRIQAKHVLQAAVDSILEASSEAKIIVMGDMNSEPKEDIIGLKNRMMIFTPQQGTHKYHGQWTCLDQFYTSASLDSISHVRIYDAEWLQEIDEKYMGLKPKRTYNGFRYQDGYSDHLPIVLDIDYQTFKH